MLDMDSSSVSDLSAPRNTRCVECMCLMTLFQEHISSKHSGDMCLYFELSEWQQAGYKQSIKWTLECDRCDFKTTSKPAMFEHIANHQMLENTLQRINQSSASTPLPKQVITTQAGIAAIDKPVYNSTPSMDYHQSDARMPDYQSETSDISEQTPLHISATCSTSKPEHDDDSPVMIIKDEYPEPEVLIHMQESDIDEINKQRAQPPPPLLTAKPSVLATGKVKSAVKLLTNEHPSHAHASSILNCLLCGFTASTPDNLMYHSRVHHNSFKCGFCGHISRNGPDLESHMIGVHQSMICIYCGVDTGSVGSLKRHYSMNHRSTVKKCKECGFTTSSLNELTNHVNKEHRRRRTQLTCPYCDYVTYAKICIRQHLLAVHIKQDLYCCPLCPMKFQRKHLVKTHLKKGHNAEMTPSMSSQIEKTYRAAFNSIAAQYQLFANFATDGNESADN